MSTPLNSADDPRRCSGRTKEGVLAKFARYYEVKDQLLPETREEKLTRYAQDIYNLEMKQRIYQTSIRPFRKATYTKFIEIDPRLRDYRSRYGAISND
ncbi:RecBCD nuclease inhibitor [Salmonella enterica]|uniref:RecBCD nuclease inhibitor n=1 Tax=Salmonella enterica TaxID=28901 RepID=A0A639WCB7_SALER|nr:RecBCD nuclease inhibitor [Salmonella enterica]